MGLFDGLSGMLETAIAKHPGGLSGMLDDALKGAGGLDGVVSKLNSSGLGGKVSSWLGQGDNQPLTADEVRSALSEEHLGQIAAKLGRSPEAVRYTIKNFDRVHPDHALFPGAGPLPPAAKGQIFQARQQLDLAREKAKHAGEPVEDTVTSIAKQFGRTRSSMYRVVNEVRARELIATPVDYIDSPEFADESRDAEFLAEMPGKAEFEAKLAAEPKFAADPDARLAWFYQRTPFYDDHYLLYPIAREIAR